jgi:hypothetical protein
MKTPDILKNPFAMLTHPNDVMHAIGNSERLRGLVRHVCRPLDKPANLPIFPGLMDYDFISQQESRL